MSARARLLPVGISQRGLTITQAATLAGLSEAAFASARSRGDYPSPTLPGGRIDRVLLERAMDRMSGLHSFDVPLDPLSAWEQKRSARTA